MTTWIHWNSMPQISNASPCSICQICSAKPILGSDEDVLFSSTSTVLHGHLNDENQPWHGDLSVSRLGAFASSVRASSARAAASRMSETNGFGCLSSAGVTLALGCELVGPHPALPRHPVYPVVRILLFFASLRLTAAALLFRAALRRLLSSTKFKVSPQNLHFFNFQFKARSRGNGVFIVRNRLVSCTHPSQASQTWRTDNEHHLKHRNQSIIGVFTQSFWLGIPTLFPLLDIDFCFGYSFIDWLAVFNCVGEL